MIINQNYIASRISNLIAEKQTELREKKNSQKRLIKIKYAIPAWLRNLIFHPLNPIFAVYKQYKANNKNHIDIFPLHHVAVDFMSYVKDNATLHFDCSKYYDEKSIGIITELIDNKLKSLLAGYNQIPMTQKQKDYKQREGFLRDKAKRIGKNCFLLKYDSHKYYMPIKVFSSYIFDFHYGLKDLPTYIKEYISNKVFLDIGAFIGDSSLIFSQYNPQQIFAYEPESVNYLLLLKTIFKNKLEKVTPVKKGLGDRNTHLPISCDGMVSSFNETAQNNKTKSELVEISTIDEECMDKTIGLIKMDVEGFEYSVVKGGLNTIKRDKPLLLISLYHTGKDFFEIPPMIIEVCPEYKFKFIDIAPSDLICDKILVGYV